MRFFRLLKIIITLHRYGLYEILQRFHKTSLLAKIIEASLWFIPKKCTDKPLPTRTRLAFEELGPVFVKFGQLLSTRQDLIAPDFIIELSKLQSQVKPFSGIIAKQIVETSLKTSLDNIFNSFSDEAVASASIAQVHKAILKETGEEVAVKILRPDIGEIIAGDVKVLQLAAWFIEKIFKDGKRLKPQDVIQEFKKTITAELDFLQEAANATELVLEWMDGIPIADIKQLKANDINLETLSHNGVNIFYTQVFNYGFFHADMHPGNILCDKDGRYIALDFGIVGCLSEEDKRYLAINILAFFNRDYKTVARTHVESGWAPLDTPIEELEGAIRAVCEPIFNKPLAEISFGQVLIKLFQVSRRFNITVQPQLLLLQKTIVNVEGMGRMLNPNLDLWVTAKPILEKWMHKQMGFRGFINNLKTELPYWSYSLPTLPRKFMTSLNTSQEVQNLNGILGKLLLSYQRQNRFLMLLIIVLVIVLWIKL